MTVLLFKHMPKLRTVHVKAGKDIPLPNGFSVHHSVLIEPKKGNPYFTVLLSNDQKQNKEKLDSAIGYKVYE